jgi:hypothetical protein
MQVYSTRSLTPAAVASVARRGVSGTFTLAAQIPQAVTASLTVSTLGDIGMLLALQGAEDATERRKRVLKRARSALDALDALKLSLLEGRVEPSTLRRLQALAGDIAADTADPRLDEVLAAIALRSQVELAKAGIFGPDAA